MKIKLIASFCLIVSVGWLQAVAQQSQAPVNAQVNKQMPLPPAGFQQQKQAMAPGKIENDMHSEGLSQRDPFRLPQYLIFKIKDKAVVSKVELAGGIDDSVEPIRRWALSTYQLVGIIWDVSRPKAMFVDTQNSIHMLHVKDRIGNSGGVISAINNGEVVVIENKTSLRLKLKK